MRPTCGESCTCETSRSPLVCRSLVCHSDANCTMSDGIRDCYCNTGYSGDGVTCSGTFVTISRKLHSCVTKGIGMCMHAQYCLIQMLIPPSHRRRGATAVLVRHKPQWHRHDRRGSAVVPSLIVVGPRKTVKPADLRSSTAATLNMFRRASAILVPSHRRRGATAVLVRHDRRGSAVVPSLIAVAPSKTVKTADLRGARRKL